MRAGLSTGSHDEGRGMGACGALVGGETRISGGARTARGGGAGRKDGEGGGAGERGEVRCKWQMITKRLEIGRAHV